MDDNTDLEYLNSPFYEYHMQLLDTYKTEPEKLKQFADEDNVTAKMSGRVYTLYVKVAAQAPNDQKMQSALAVAQRMFLQGKMYQLMSTTFHATYNVQKELLDMMLKPSSPELDEAMDLAHQSIKMLSDAYTATSMFKASVDIAKTEGKSEYFEDFSFQNFYFGETLDIPNIP